MEGIREAKALVDGEKAFYDGVPRYKNPYVREDEREEESAWWRGWDSASEEHRIFAENKELKETIENQKIQIDRLKEESAREQKKTLDEVEVLRKEILLKDKKIEESWKKVLELIDYDKDSNIFTFRRKEVIKVLEEIWGILTREY